MNKTLCSITLGLAAGWSVASAQPASASAVDFGDASLLHWVQPEYPELARKAKLEGEVMVEFVVELDGRVSQANVKESTNELLNDAALAAVQRWTFNPAVEDGKPVVSAMSATLPFRLAQLKQKQVPIAPPGQEFMPAGLKLTPAKAKFAPDPDYPAELEEKKLPGEVEIEFKVDAEGKIKAPRVLWASHAAFVETALRAVEKSQFEPAHQGPLAKATTMKYPVEFQSIGSGSKRADILEANHITVVTAPAPEVLPTPVVLIEPVYPCDRLLAGEQGSAEVKFLLGDNGHTAEVTVVSATAPQYGAALAAAVEAWMFQPAMSEGARQPVRLQVAYAFIPQETGAIARLAADMRPGGAGVSGPAGLDQRLKPLWRGFPVYPQALRAEKSTGEATIEFIIDRDGRARLPRIGSASKDEFGWAAATAISQWVFERPIRNGEPVDVRVSIPVSFAPPGNK